LVVKSQINDLVKI